MTLGRALGGAAGLAIGAFGLAMLAGMAANHGAKATAAVTAVFCLGLLIVLAGDAVFVLLGLLVIAISYNRQFYTLDAVVGDYGPGGAYWTAADAVVALILIALLALLALTGRATPRPVPRQLSIEPAMIALIAAMAASALRTDVILPPMLETLRIVKYLAIFLLIRSLLDRERQWAIFAGLMLLIFLQSGIGMVQVALGAGGAGLSSLSAQEGEMARRATGTLGHPNMYAPFLLNFALGFLAVALAPGKGWLRLACLAIGGAGALAIILSQSRAPAAAMMLALGGVALTLTLRGQLPARRLLGGTAVVLMLGALAVAPLTQKIMDRLTGDFSGSIEFRAGYNEAALGIWASDPLFGVGPTGFVPALGRYDANLAETNRSIQSARLAANVKTIAPVHNVYLWLLAEIGLLGILAFAAFLAALAWLFWQAGRGDRTQNLFFVGVFWGFLGVGLQQTTDFSLWWDHHMTMLMVLAAFASFTRDSGRIPA